MQASPVDGAVTVRERSLTKARIRDRIPLPNGHGSVRTASEIRGGYNQGFFVRFGTSLLALLLTVQTDAFPQDSTKAILGHLETAKRAFMEGRLSDAVAEYEQAAQLKPESEELKYLHAWSLVTWGQSLQAKARPESARKAWNQALSRYPGFVPALEALAAQALLQNDFRAAQQHLTSAEKLEPKNPRVIILRSQLESAWGNLERSFDQLSRLPIEQLDGPTGLQMLGQLLRLDLEKQAAALLKRLTLKPEEKMEGVNLFIKFGKYDQAAKLLSSLPDSASTRLLQGLLHTRQLRFNEAERAFKGVIAEDPKNWSAYYYMGQAYTQAGRAEQATRVLEKAHKLQADNLNILVALGRAARRAGQHREALGWLGKGREIEGTAFELHLELGQTFREINQLEEAREHFQMALSQQPNHSQAHYLLGQLYQQTGQAEKAGEHLRQFQMLKTHAEKEQARLRDVKRALKGREPIVAESPRSPSQSR